VVGRNATLAVALAAVSIAGCKDATRRATATRLSTIEQRIGGPKALGDVGDYLLENDKIRLIIHGPGDNRSTTVYGGSLIDADLQRPNGTRSRGNDQLGEFLPAFVFEAMDPADFRITATGEDGGPAIVTLEGVGGDVLQTVALLNTALIFPPGLSFRTDYILEPGNSYVEIKTTVTNTSAEVHRLPFVDPPGLADFGIDLPGLDELQLSTPFGHYMILGAEQKTFAPGRAGFNVRFTTEELYDEAGGLPAFPGVVADFVATRGKGVSYGFTHEGGAQNYVSNFSTYYPSQSVKPYSVLVPFLFSALTAVYHTNPPPQLQPGEEFSYSIYFIVGRGDVGSIGDVVYDIHGISTGVFSGRVYDAQSQAPVALASIVVRTDDAARDYVTQYDTDENGNFRGNLPSGNYTYEIVTNVRNTTRPVAFTIVAGQTTVLEFPDNPCRKNGRPCPGYPLEPSGVVTVQVTDQDGRQLPSKITLVGRFDAADQGRDPRDFLYDLGLGEHQRFTAFDPARNEFIEGTWYTPDGLAVAHVRPGTYDLLVSRGVEYDLHTESITVGPGMFIERRVTLNQSVNTDGYVSTDLHLHAVNSVDSSMSLEDRVVSIAGEGVEYAAATDHNAVTDYAPAIAATGLDQWLISSVGIEVTSFEMGHFNAYPLEHQSSSVRGGDVVWAGQTPDQIFEQMRAIGRYGAEATLIQVNHPRWDFLGYFNAFSYDQELGEATTKAGLASVFAPFGPEFAIENFSFDFDVIEILNGKRQDLVHSYRVPEVLPPPPLPDPATIPPAGEILRTDAGTIAFPGALEDWFSMLNQGYRHIAVGTSDSHRQTSEAGFARTYVWVGEGKDKPGGFTEVDVADGLRSRRAIISMGPIAEFFINDQPIGSEITDTDGSVDLVIRVQTANWMETNRLVVYGNGQVVADMAIPAGQGRDYTTNLSLNIDKDTWFVLEVTGDTNMFPVVTPDEFPGTSPQAVIDALSVGFDLSGLDPFGNLRPQETQQATPLAITNPIWVDFDGSGSFDAPGAMALTRQPSKTLPNVRDSFGSFKEDLK
jgi:hypothetical protein